MTAPTPPAIATSEANPEEVIWQLEMRTRRGGSPGYSGFYSKRDVKLDRQAIDLIRSLEGEIADMARIVERNSATTARLEQKYTIEAAQANIAAKQALSRLSAAEEENKRLREGLEPFQFKDQFPDYWPDASGALVYVDTDAVRAVRSLLSGRES